MSKKEKSVSQMQLRLEEIVAEFNKDGRKIDLDNDVVLYQEAAELVVEIKKQLQVYTQKVNEIKLKYQ